MTATNSRYRGYLLGLLTAILAFNYVDRLALGVVLQSIKTDLALTDTELGLISGLAFAVFYSVMGIPLARWADRGNRVTLIAATAAIWSIMVILCGAARTLIQLVLIRIGVGVGESGCIPPAHSLLADYFARADRPRAMARYALGGPLSSVIGFYGAGWLNTWLGWRATFVVIGLPGLVLSALAWWTLREPRRDFLCAQTSAPLDPHVLAPTVARSEDKDSRPPPLREACALLARNGTFMHLLAALSLIAFFSLGAATWQPAFFQRRFALSTAAVGTGMALTYGLGGLVGTLVGGEWAARRAARNEPRQLGACAIAQCLFGVISVLVYCSSTYWPSFVLLAIGAVGPATTSGPLFATVQSLVPERLRAFSVSVIFLFSNLIGLGLGPLVVGALSDALRPSVGEDSLRFALLVTTPGYLWVGWHLWCASRRVSIDLARTS